MKATQTLHDLGQSLWLDNITRDLLQSGTLERYIEELSVTGLTSNPTILDHAIKNSPAYDAEIKRKVQEGKAGEDLLFELALEDLTRAADLFRPIWDRTRGVDGWVSLQVSPLLAHDADKTLAAAKALHARAGRPNFLIKIPGTPEGLPAIEEAIFAGVPINVTLLFSREQYLAAAEAFLRGIERRVAAGLPPEVGSVASLFVSRWDRRGQGSSAGGAAQSVRHRDREADVLGVPDAARLCALAARLQRRRPPATSAVGQHGHERSRRVRHSLHRGACRAVHGEHDARGHLEGTGGSWRDWGSAARGRRRQR
jgi:transaldolase